MDKFKEKLNALRIEAEGATSRAVEAETQCKRLQEALQSKENEILSLQNKNTLLSGELERAEARIGQVKQQKQESDAVQSQSEAFNRKISLLENELDLAKKNCRDAVEKARQLELVAEQAERKVSNLEHERSELEKKLEDVNQKYLVVKRELEDTLKSINDL